MKGETSESCALFWKIVNEMLGEVTKKKDYKFNPKHFIVVEAGANFNGIQFIFKGYCISSVNLAEIGHSALKRAKPIALVDAAWKDTCTMILQEQEHTKFLTRRCYSSGKGPSAG